jgi:DNA-directed RNA polymerase subunit RPC12/RpoP
MNSALIVTAIIALAAIAIAAMSIATLAFSFRYAVNYFTSYAARRAIDKVVDLGGQGVTNLATSVSSEMKRNDPKRLEPQVFQLAKSQKGKLTSSEIVASCDVPISTAQACLAALVRRNACRPKQEGRVTYYIFENYLAETVLRTCGFCQTEFPLNDEALNCPNCGGKIETVKQKVE